LLEDYYLPGDLEAQTGLVIEHYNHHPPHERLKNLTPAAVTFGPAKKSSKNAGASKDSPLKTSACYAAKLQCNLFKEYRFSLKNLIQQHSCFCKIQKRRTA